MWQSAKFPRIRNYVYSDGKTRPVAKFSIFTCCVTEDSYGARYNTATETTFTINGAPDSC